MKLTTEGKGLKYKKYLSVLGAIVALSNNGIFWYWGNLSVYSKSHLVAVRAATTYINTPSVVSANIVLWTIGATVSGFLAKRIGRRSTMLIGSVLTDAGILASYWAVQTSALALTFTMGVITGLGTGLLDTSGLQILVDWADDDTATLTSVAHGVMCLCGFILNQIITAYANSRNLAPEFEFEQKKLFVQREVVDKIPSLYLIIAGISIFCHLTGLFLIRNKPRQPGFGKGRDCAKPESLPIRIDASRINEDTGMELKDFSAPRENGTSDEIMSTTYSQGKTKDYLPKEMMKTRAFWALWFTFFLGDINMLVLINYYKVFGQLWISDDHFLTDVGSAFVLAIAVVNLFWGRVMDKLGVKNCFMMCITCLVVIQAWYCLCPRFNQWIYGLATVLLGCIAGSMISGYTVAIALIFGKKHFSTNLAVLVTSSLTFNFAAPVIIESVLTHLGWFGLLALTSGTNVCRLLIVMVFMPPV